MVESVPHCMVASVELCDDHGGGAYDVVVHRGCSLAEVVRHKRRCLVVVEPAAAVESSK